MRLEEPPIGKAQTIMIDALCFLQPLPYNCIFRFHKVDNILATQGTLTYCANRTLPYNLYADGSGLLVLALPEAS